MIRKNYHNRLIGIFYFSKILSLTFCLAKQVVKMKIRQSGHMTFYNVALTLMQRHDAHHDVASTLMLRV